MGDPCNYNSDDAERVPLRMVTSNGNMNDDNGDSNFTLDTLIDSTGAQSKDYIIQNDRALTVLSLEYGSVIIGICCIIFSILSVVNGDVGDQFKLFQSDITGKGIGYTIAVSLLSFVDSFMITFGIFKVKNASLSGILDTSDVLFTFILAYVWLGETTDVYGVIGALLIVLSVAISVYPWEIHPNIPKSF